MRQQLPFPEQRSLFDAPDPTDRILQMLAVTWQNVQARRKWIDEHGFARVAGECAHLANVIDLECLRVERLSRGIQVPKRAYRTRRVAATAQ